MNKIFNIVKDEVNLKTMDLDFNKYDTVILTGKHNSCRTIISLLLLDKILNSLITSENKRPSIIIENNEMSSTDLFNIVDDLNLDSNADIFHYWSKRDMNKTETVFKNGRLPNFCIFDNATKMSNFEGIKRIKTNSATNKTIIVTHLDIDLAEIDIKSKFNNKTLILLAETSRSIESFSLTQLN